MTIKIYDRAPEGFVAAVEVAACYLEIDGKILLLQRAGKGLEPGKWSVPAGKVEKGESLGQAAIRELFEETGILLEKASQIQYTGTLYMQKPEISYAYRMFTVYLEKTPEVRLSYEHQSYTWAFSRELKEISLMAGAEGAFEHYQRLLAGEEGRSKSL